MSPRPLRLQPCQVSNDVGLPLSDALLQIPLPLWLWKQFDTLSEVCIVRKHGVKRKRFKKYFHCTEYDQATQTRGTIAWTKPTNSYLQKRSIWKPRLQDNLIGCHLYNTLLKRLIIEPLLSEKGCSFTLFNWQPKGFLLKNVRLHGQHVQELCGKVKYIYTTFNLQSKCTKGTTSLTVFVRSTEKTHGLDLSTTSAIHISYNSCSTISSWNYSASPKYWRRYLKVSFF